MTLLKAKICFEALAATVNKIFSELLGTESVYETLEHLVILTHHPTRDVFIAVRGIFSSGASLKRGFLKRFIALRVYTVCKSNRMTGLDRPLGFQEVETPRFQDSRHMKVVRSALRTGCLYPSPPQEVFLVLISVRG